MANIELQEATMAATATASSSHLLVWRTRPTPISSRRDAIFYRCQSVRNTLASNRLPSSLVSSGGRNRQGFLRPLPLVSCSNSAQLSSDTSSSSPRPVSDSQDVAKSHSSAPTPSDSSSPVTSGHQEFGEMDRFSAAVGGLLGAFVLFLKFPEASLAAASEAVTELSSFPPVMTFVGAEPSNALSLPTWIIHVASVAEWITAMALVWKYGETDGNSAWKGLTWGMVPLLGGATCACTWHFFYNAESLEVLLVLQAFLTVVGNFTVWAAAFNIWQSSQKKP